MTELLRLGVVGLLTAAGYTAGGALGDVLGLGDADTARLTATVLGALVGYVLGGLIGRSVVRSVDEAQGRLEQVDAIMLVAGALGAALGGLVGLVLLAPVLLLPLRQFTAPIALLVVVALAYGGGRLGAARAGDLSRFVGMRGRLEVRSPSRGAGTKLVDTSALIDGRLVDVARAGFLEGTLVVPRFVLLEVQSQADATEPRRRQVARRGLESLRTLQNDGIVAVELADDEVADFSEIDAKLAELCRERQAALVTVDANLGRVAEIGGVRVLNLHQLAEAVRPPVLPGERIKVRILREGREPGQGVGYLDDGTMVVVERAAGQRDTVVPVEITSVVGTARGRMLFATPTSEDLA